METDFMADIPQPHPLALREHIQRGDLAPPCTEGPNRFFSDRFPGRYLVLCFYQEARDTVGQATFRALQERRKLVEQKKAAFICVSSNPAEKTERELEQDFPSLTFLWDFDASVKRSYGVGRVRVWIILDPMQRVLDVILFRPDGSDRQQLFAFLDRLPSPSRPLGFEAQAPFLILPNVLEPEFCRHLINIFEQDGGRESGFMRETSGKAVETFDPKVKRRKDYTITDEALMEQIKARIARRIGPMMVTAFQFKPSRVERYLIACYSAEDGGHFAPHRDNTIKATAHRRFAVTFYLNDDFEGGGLVFPEFSAQQIKAPIGAAVIFSSSLLHCVSTVTRGRRYAFLPFIHDEEAEKIRIANLQFLSHPALET
jgi:predicted 2-oxoglutarate/Fe(II)-dependent dioxygenase YbiX/peroxiredoxin